MLFFHPRRILRSIRDLVSSFFWYYLVPDPIYVRYKYRKVFKKKLNLRNPQTFNEKINWLKLYDRNPLYHTLVDKIEVKKWVANKIGSEYIIPTLAIWDKVTDVDFSILPDQFIIKCNHDSASWSICTDKKRFNKEKTLSILSEAMRHDYYHYDNKQWVYKGIRRRILAEPLLKDSEDIEVGLTDYKFYCFSGKPDCVLTAFNREKKHPEYYFFDREWNLLRYNRQGLSAPADFKIPKPDKLDEMFAVAEKLACGFRFVRVDLYYSCGQIYFGEMTFNPEGGTNIKNLLPETDLLFGKKLLL